MKLLEHIAAAIHWLHWIVDFIFSSELSYDSFTNQSRDFQGGSIVCSYKIHNKLINSQIKSSTSNISLFQNRPEEENIQYISI